MTKAYINENTKHVVCYSGGHSSALVAIEVFRKYGNKNIVLLNHDINASVENEDIKRFKREVAAHIGVEVTYANHKDKELKDIPDQFDIIEKIGYFTDRSRNVLCTYELKTKPFYDWLAKYHPDKNVVIYYGFDKNEKNRIQRRSSILGQQGYRSDYPLALWERTIESTKEIGIEPPLTYSQFKHANCVGCLKAGRQHWYVVYCTRPDIWEKAKRLEALIDYSIIKGTFLEEIEEKFEKMKCAGIEASEKLPPATFWKKVRDTLKDMEMDDDTKPCECLI